MNRRSRSCHPDHFSGPRSVPLLSIPCVHILMCVSMLTPCLLPLPLSQNPGRGWLLGSSNNLRWCLAPINPQSSILILISKYFILHFILYCIHIIFYLYISIYMYHINQKERHAYFIINHSQRWNPLLKYYTVGKKNKIIIWNFYFNVTFIFNVVWFILNKILRVVIKIKFLNNFSGALKLMRGLNYAMELFMRRNK